MLDLYPQHVIFIALLVWGLMMILDRVFVRPVGAVINARESKIENENAQIETMSSQIGEKVQYIETVLRDARKESSKIKEELIKKGEEIREIIIRDSREQSRILLREKLAELDREISRAEHDLEQEIGAYSQKLREIMLG